MAGIEITTTSGCDWIRITLGRANVVGPEFLTEMRRVLLDISSWDDERAARPVIVTGDGNSFCAGLDLETLLDFGRGELESFLADFRKIFLDLARLPRPTVAAVNGHAIGAGCLLVLACDWRLAADRLARSGREYGIGLRVSTLGLPLPPFAASLIRASLPLPSRLELTLTGDLFAPPEALRLRMLDRIVPAQELQTAAQEEAERLTRTSGGTAARLKVQMKEALVEEQARDPDHDAFLEAWFSKETQRRLRSAASDLRDAGLGSSRDPLA